MNRLSMILDFLSYEGQPTNDPEDAIKIKSRYEESSAREIRRLKEQIVDTTVDRSIALPDATTDLAIIFTDQEISIKINSSSDSITLKPKTAGCKTLAWVLKGDLTDLLISNASGQDANVDIILAQI